MDRCFECGEYLKLCECTEQPPMTEPTEQDRDGELVTKLGRAAISNDGKLKPRVALRVIREHMQAEREELRELRKVLDHIAVFAEQQEIKAIGPEQTKGHFGTIARRAHQALKGTSDE